MRAEARGLDDVPMGLALIGPWVDEALLRQGLESMGFPPMVPVPIVLMYRLGYRVSTDWYIVEPRAGVTEGLSGQAPERPTASESE